MIPTAPSPRSRSPIRFSRRGRNPGSAGAFRFLTAMTLFVLAAAAQAGTISGRITAQGGGNLANIDLDIYDAQDNPITTLDANSDASGLYTFNNVPNGKYKIKADPKTPPDSYLVDEFWAGSPTTNAYRVADAAAVTVSGANPGVGGINFVLEEGGTLSGRITQAGTGTALAGIDLDLFDAAHNKLPFSATSDASGQYQFKPFPTGASATFLVRADPPKATSFLVDQYYSAKAELRLADPVTVTRLQNTPAVNFALVLGGTISGQILEGTTPRAGIDLDLYDASTGIFVPAYDAASGADGTYVLGPFPAGSYKIAADPDPSTFLIRQFWDQKLDVHTATSITVSAGAMAASRNFNLQKGGTIEGTIRRAQDNAPVAGVDLDLFTTTGAFIPEFDAKSDATGHYVVGPVPAGSYLLRADPGKTSALVRQYFNHKTDKLAATTISVSVGAAATPIDFLLPGGGTIRGKVKRSSDGASLPDFDLDVFLPDGSFLVEFNTRTDVLGDFVLGPMPPGAYIVRADAQTTQAYVDQFYSGSKFLAGATSVPVVVGGAADITFSLLEGHLIRGRIVTAGTGTPVPHLEPDLYDENGVFLPYEDQNSDLNGDYTIGPVPAGLYVVAVKHPTQGRIYYPGVASLQAAQRVPMSTQDVTGINFTVDAIPVGVPSWLTGVMLLSVLQVALSRMAQIEPRG